MPNSQFYPAVAELIPLDKIPPSLGVISGGLQNIFSKIFYRDFVLEKSMEGDAIFLKSPYYRMIGLASKFREPEWQF